MATAFFSPWALWAKMTFVLALAILAVFAIGYGKLVWTNRRAKRHEGRDEEERLKVEASRQSGKMAVLRKSQDIPFGVRAIQSGIQVDGIWQSRSGTPVPGSLRFSHTSSLKGNGSQSPSPRASLDISQAGQPNSSRGRTSSKPSEPGSLPLSQSGTDDLKGVESQDAHGYRPSYKPRRSSHLRYDSRGEAKYNEETLNHLEGRSVRGSDVSQGLEMEGEISSGAAADNGRSSGSETDLALSGNLLARSCLQRQSLPVGQSQEKHLSEPRKHLNGSVRASLPSQSSNGYYFAVPLESPELVSSRLETALPPRPPYAQTAGELTASGEAQVPLLSKAPPAFTSGDLHMNRTARKVNSGFEVLPAGTFGMPIEHRRPSIERENRWNRDGEAGEKRSSNRLRKKIRTSVSSRRPSITIDSP